MKRLRLMIPGPIELDPEVLSVMAEPLVAHYGDEWTQFYQETMDIMKKVFGTRDNVFLIPGSGSAGLDAVLGSTVFPDRKVLILENGFFGERLAEIAATYTPNIAKATFPIGQPIDLDQVDSLLKKGCFTTLVMTHCETSTGMLNPVKEVARFCQKHDVLFIVDAISSLGIESLEMDQWGIDICVSASQKGLESPPGLALVAVGKEGWKAIEKSNPPGWYLSLKVWKEYEEKWGNWHPHPITQAVNNVRALRVGLERILNEGMQARVKRHKEVTSFLREGISNRGFSLLIPDEIASHGVTAVMSVNGDVQQILSYLRDKHGLLLAGSLGALKGKVFRIGHMGPVANIQTIERLLFALDEYEKDASTSKMYGG